MEGSPRQGCQPSFIEDASYWPPFETVVNSGQLRGNAPPSPAQYVFMTELFLTKAGNVDGRVRVAACERVLNGSVRS